ncbi:hypothetical protein OESDEN_19816 [Oesophagostomum dentatum]|uniref:Uncharacterized protein n=1 Tax=Oesophagostomum dentatum TaxID=61180 RepID=A0A0B1S6F8_OESDE|nr:hypothetical protein OESDEN_19816 [Oesophagostomum dentatum]
MSSFLALYSNKTSENNVKELKNSCSSGKKTQPFSSASFHKLLRKILLSLWTGD